MDPETDVVPPGANCHAMVHRRRDTVTSIDGLKALIDKAKGLAFRRHKRPQFRQHRRAGSGPAPRCLVEEPKFSLILGNQ